MNIYQVVTNYQIISEIKRSKYFKVNLGLSGTLDTGQEFRVYNDKDEFAYSYNVNYNTIIYAQGNIGNIKFYVDHYIRDQVLAVYYNLEEFIIPFDENKVIEKGVDSFIGSVLLTVDEEYKRRIQDNELKEKEKTEKKGDPEKLISNPGQVTYADIEQYLKRYKK